jgi:propane monooxygenase reductase subunit
LIKVEVHPFGHTFECNEGETILQAALRNKRLLRYGCGHGGCGSCKVALIQGDVEALSDSYALDHDDRAQDVVLACSSVPVEDCTIDVTRMELTEDEFLSGDTSTTFNVRLEALDAVCADIYRVRLKLVEPDRIEFAAGQFVNVTVPGTSETRSYSMANAPSDDSTIELYCRTYPGGAFSDYLITTARPGDELVCSGPYGLLKLRPSHRPILMVGGGSGLAPLLALLRDIADRGIERPVTLFFGARTEADLYALDEIRDLEQRIADFSFVPVLSESWSESWAGDTGLVTEAVAGRFDRMAHDLYLCGPPPMIDATTALAVARGSRPRNIYFDAFVPAAQSPSETSAV